MLNKICAKNYKDNIKKIIMAESQSDIDIMRSLNIVWSQMKEAVKRRSQSLPQVEPRLVCVSKTKSTTLIIEAYEAGQKHFGENYVNELNEKANSDDILDKCKDIKWHFIGHLQSNKVNKVLSSPGLYMIETIHSKKIAETVNKQWPKYAKDNECLNVMVQVNTSGEDAKSGVDPKEVTDLVKFVKEQCSSLTFKGLMTIGEYGFDCSTGPNPDFLHLVECRKEVSTILNLKIDEIELSMGMSSDFEHAIEMGATNVRVGSTIFGSR